MKSKDIIIKTLVCVMVLIGGYNASLYAQSEELTITTFYPSPYGIYRVVKLEPSDAIGGAGGGCAAIERGEIQYNSTDNTLLLCDGSTWVELGGEEGDYLWQYTGGAGGPIVNRRSSDVNVTSNLNVPGTLTAGTVNAGTVNAPTVNATTVNATTVNTTDVNAAGTVTANTVIANLLHSNGDITANGSVRACGADIAEPIPAAMGIEAGDVVRIDPEKINEVVKTSVPYDVSVAGIISTKPGVELGQEWKKEGTQLLALAGNVPCKVTTSNGVIQPGDLLTTSSKPGYAMKFTLLDYSQAQDMNKLKAMMKENEQRRLSIIGRALEPLKEGDGKIHVLVTK
ncbi:MAG: hypothetical protein JXD21_01985 [Candidatus Omnitrophica bacterium]|nr:hypothetical protein [Candidatus Omnitrophota bacterium]